MTDHLFATIFTDAIATSNREGFVSDWARSSAWGDAEGAEIPAPRIKALGNIWDAAHRSIADIRRASGLSRPAFAERLLIPYRTVQDWELGNRTCPDYLRLLIAEHFGLVNDDLFNHAPRADRNGVLRTDLSGSDLSGADMSRAGMSGTDLSGVDLSDVFGLDETKN